MKTMRRALPIVRGHHEKLDGSGYPQGLTAPDITLPVRIVAVTDVFDALVSDRAYRRAFSVESALEVLSEGVRKGWWDGDVVEALEGLVSTERQRA